MLYWLSGWIKKRVVWYADVVKGSYDALVLDGGPGGDIKNYRDFDVSLEMKERFDQKNLEKLEIFLYFAFQSSEREGLSKRHKTDLATAYMQLISKKWKDRNYDGFPSQDIKFEHEMKMYEKFLVKPIDWSNEWMAEFNDASKDVFFDEIKEIGWGSISFLDHSKKQHLALKNVINGLA